MRITSKGQVTIPQDIRERFDLHPGTEVEFVVEANRIVLRKNRKLNPVDEWLRNAVGVAKKGTTTDEIMQQTRGED